MTYNVSDAAGNAATQVSRTVVVEAAESEEPFDGTVLALADQNVSEGASTVTVPVTVSGFSGIGGFQFTVAWDPAALTFNSVGDFDHSTATTELFFFGETNFNLDNVSDGYFTVLYEQILAADATVADGETIFSVTFDVLGATGSSSEVSFTDDPTLRKLASFGGAAPLLKTVNATISIGPQDTSPTDTTAPVITLLGDASVTVTVGDTYSDAGATASDDTDGDLTTSIVVDGGTVDTSAAGTYTVTYNVSDAAGNAATQVSRTVVVEAAAPSDTTAPVITLLGDASVTVAVGATYSDAGATASDDTDGDLTASIVVDGGAVDTSAAGTYTVTYNVSDAAGKCCNASQAAQWWLRP